MTGVSEVEYRVAREIYHLNQATRARDLAAARRHAEMARRCFDYRYPVTEIEAVESAPILRLV